MGMNADQSVTSTLLLDPLDQVVGHLWLKQTVHVVYADGIATHLLDLLRNVHEHRDRVHRTRPITDCADRVLASLLHGFNTGLQVPDIVECVKDAEPTD